MQPRKSPSRLDLSDLDPQLRRLIRLSYHLDREAARSRDLDALDLSALSLPLACDLALDRLAGGAA